MHTIDARRAAHEFALLFAMVASITLGNRDREPFLT